MKHHQFPTTAEARADYKRRYAEAMNKAMCMGHADRRAYQASGVFEALAREDADIRISEAAEMQSIATNYMRNLKARHADPVYAAERDKRREEASARRRKLRHDMAKANLTKHFPDGIDWDSVCTNCDGTGEQREEYERGQWVDGACCVYCDGTGVKGARIVQ